MGKLQSCDKEEEVVIIRKGAWSADEDAKLVQYIKQHGHCTWRDLPKQAGLLRCGKSCRLRWVNYLCPDIKRGPFTPEEETYIIQLQSLLGNKWAAIASHFPGRTDNEIKNVWNTRLKKRKYIAQTKSVMVEESLAGKTDSDDVFLRLWNSEVGKSFRKSTTREFFFTVDEARARGTRTSSMEINSQKQEQEDDDIYRPNVELMVEADSDSMIMSSNEFPKYSSDTTATAAALRMLLDFHGGDNNMEFLHDHDCDFLSSLTR
ncbi:hypothetical protein LWI28_013299 [Acer negundo]|uniref:Uncharacterized protein n=1 Tax=Acer negundo TaxID=4023 RepID=A0AAD5IDS2_ACENE|nr:hypothetical protein LWI28_013299 [Acer negundo]KAK4838024.1 hypothetical protein QYF36_010426 [Acer negundo]